MERLPSLFISHGSPMILLDDCPARHFLAHYGQEMERPDAILMISAHWETQRVTVGSASKPPTIHDFYGFPEPLYRYHYPATGHQKLAGRTFECLRGAGFDAVEDEERGLDHGAWVPLAYMFPEGDVPVAQISIQSHLGARHHYEMGKALAPLRDENILILGSGNVTHGRRAGEVNEPVFDWVSAFSEWTYECVMDNRAEDLIEYLSEGPYAFENHPTPDHYVPLLIALGAAGENARAKRLHTSYTYRTISMDSYEFQ